MARLGRGQHFKPLLRPFNLIVIVTVNPPSIASGERFGSLLSVIPIIQPTGIASAETFGTPQTAPSVNVSPSSIGSAEAFGTPSVNLSIAVTGFTSAAFGTPTIELTVTPTGISSGEAFGTTSVVLVITCTGIPSAQAFGTSFVGLVKIINPLTGIPSAEAFGPDTYLFNYGPPTPTGTPAIFAGQNALAATLNSQARGAITAADRMAQTDLAAPTDIQVLIYDKVYKLRGECNDYISLTAAFPRHLVETGTLVMKGDDPLVEAALLCHEEVVPVVIEIGNLLWSGRIKVAKDRFGFKGEADTVICELEGDRAWLMKILAWPNFLLPVQVQFPPRGVAIGPAISVIRWLLACQCFRLQSGLWDLINNLGSLNLDWRSWFGTFLMQDALGSDGHFDFADIMRMLRTPIYVVQTNLTGALSGILHDTSPFISINWRMDKMYELIDQVVKDNGLVVECKLWRPGDPQPDEHMIFPLTVPTICVDVKDRMNIVGPTGTFIDGILRTLVDLQDSVFGDITKPFLNPQGLPAPEGFNIAPLLGINWIQPWALFNADHPQSACWGEMAHHHPLAWRTVIGGRSPKWMNDLINATLSFFLDMLMIIIGFTGVPSTLLDGLFSDVLLAFALADNFDRREKLGPYGYPEWFQPTGHAPYNIDGIFAMKREQWNTRGYVSGIVTFDNGYPYEIGRDLFVGSLATIVRRGKAYTDFVENIVVTDNRQELKVEVQIGDGVAEEPTSVKLYRNVVKFQEAINILLMSSGQ